jgi:Zn-dependent M28 family amino/carboxypeptidase
MFKSFNIKKNKSSDFWDSFLEKKRIIANCKEIIFRLSSEIGERTLNSHESLDRAQKYIIEKFSQYGSVPGLEQYSVGGKQVANIIAEIRGTAWPEKIIVIGAHYDTVEGSPGADDNASAVAGLLELYWLLSMYDLRRTVRFTAFTLEEPPYFGTEHMGSFHHAAGCRRRNESIEIMLCLEMLGYGGKNFKQEYPSGYMQDNAPRMGNFLLAASLPSSSEFVDLWKTVYNRNARDSIYDIVGPSSIPGIGLSDHYSFHRHNYRSMMLTDTAFYRNKNYHTENDTFDTINFNFLADNIINSFLTVREIANMEKLPYDEADRS